MMSITDLKNQFIKSPLMTCRYSLLITPPSSVNQMLLSYKLAVLSKSITMPKISAGFKKISYRGRPVLVRSQLEYDDNVTVSVYEDCNMNVRRMLEKWINAVDIRGNGYDKYKDGEIVLYQLDNNNNEVYGVRFNDVFLTGLGEISYTAEGHEIPSYDLTFAYSGFETLLT